MSNKKRKFHKSSYAILYALKKATFIYAIALTIAFIINILSVSSGNQSQILSSLVLCLVSSLFILIISFLMNLKIIINRNFSNPPVDNCFMGMNKKSRLYRNATKHLAEGKFNMALQIYQSIENMNPDKEEAAVISSAIGECYQYMGYPTNAIQYYKKYTDHDKNKNIYLLPYINTARCYALSGQFDNAVECFNNLHEKIPSYENYYSELGMIELKRKNFEAALKLFLYAIEKHLGYQDALCGAAVAYAELGDFNKSKEYFKSAVLNNCNGLDQFLLYYYSVCKSVGFNPAEVAADVRKDVTTANKG